MELTEEYIKNLEFVGAGNFGTLYRNGNVIYKLYKEEVKGTYYNYHDNPSLNRTFYNKYRLNKLKSLSGKIKNCNLITDFIYIDGKFRGVISNYVEGDILKDKQDKLDVREKTIISKKLIKCVSDLHKNNIYPLDIHLGNVLVDDNLDVNVIDLDDCLTKVRLIGNPMIVRWSNLKLRDTIYSLFRDFSCYSRYEDRMSKYIKKKNLPKFSCTFNGMNKYLAYKNIPLKYIFISRDTNIEEIRNIVTPDTLVAYVYEDNGFESYRDAILYFIDNGIVINNTIQYAFKDIFLSNHNVVSFHNMSLGESEHVLVKK